MVGLQRIDPVLGSEKLACQRNLVDGQSQEVAGLYREILQNFRHAFSQTEFWRIPLPKNSSITQKLKGLSKRQ